MQPASQSTPSIKRNSAWMLGARVLRMAVQAAYFVMLARSLGLQQYGAFVGAAALAGVLSPFSSLGTGNLLVKHVARDQSSLPRWWGCALTVTCISGLALTMMAVLVGHFLLPATVPAAMVLLLALAELVFGRIVEVAGQAFQAVQQLHHTAVLLVVLSVARMLAAAALMFRYSHPTAAEWAAFYLASTALPAIAACVAVNRRLGVPVIGLSVMRGDVREGMYFSISLAAQTIYNDIDKTMLARMAGLGAAGLYGAAYRLLDVSFAPIGSLLVATYPRFFQHGAQGLSACLKFTKKLVTRAVLYGAGMSLVLVLFSPAVLPVLGKQYADAAVALRYLAPIVLLRSIHYFFADTLTATGFQGLRSGIQVCVAVVNVLLNLYVIPRYSWRGAACTSVVCDSLLLLLLFISISILRWKASPRAGAVETAAGSFPRPAEQHGYQP